MKWLFYDDSDSSTALAASLVCWNFKGYQKKTELLKEIDTFDIFYVEKKINCGTAYQNF